MQESLAEEARERKEREQIAKEARERESWNLKYIRTK